MTPLRDVLLGSKFNQTRPEIEARLFQLLSAQVMRPLGAEPLNESLVYCAQLRERRTQGALQPVVDFSVYRATYSPEPGIHTVAEWFYAHRLWFRPVPTTQRRLSGPSYESFVSYLEDYRPHFTVDAPLLTLTLPY